MDLETGFSDLTKKNLKNVEREIDQENVDWPIAVEGKEGSGKSAVAQALGIEIDGEKFDPEKQIAFSGEEFERKAKKIGADPSRKVVIYDEGVDDLMATDTMTSESRERVKFFRQCRELNLIPIVVMPVFVEMNKKIRNNRIKTLARCMKKGKPGNRTRYVLWYGEETLKEIEKDGDDVNYPSSNSSDQWSDPEQEWPEIWETYIEMKKGNLNDDSENEEDQISVPEIVRIVKNRKDDYIDERGDRKFIRKELIEYDFDVGGRKSKKVKAVVERDLNLG
jgi:hypothetical protein